MSPLPTHASAAVRAGARDRARPHTRRVRLATGLALLAPLLGLAACDGGDAHGSSGGTALAKGTDSERLNQLIAAMTPLRADLTSDHHDRHLHEGRALLEELKHGDRELGLEALRVYEEGGQEIDAVRRGLLTVAAYCAPEDMRKPLEDLILVYGAPIADRAVSIDLLAETSPERAIEVYEPLMKKKKQRSTMPDDEFFVRAYIVACRETGHDPVPALADVATNIMKQPASRYFAVEELGQHPGKQSFNVLRTILVESTGDAYLRRKAAQAIRNSVPSETACEIFREVLSKEAEQNFAIFMLDMIEDNCE
ncbi:MAG: hypothetical protein H6831_14610 [Planctomycetes bacterium]|nr:hypothetical protein [Planctomycetota bacterium]MCB9905635.1 hypothetical protein [Planctomycetota bacterium]